MVHSSSSILIAAIAINAAAPAFAAPFKLPAGAAPINETTLPDGAHIVALRETGDIEARVGFGQDLAGGLAGVVSNLGASDIIKKLE